MGNLKPEGHSRLEGDGKVRNGHTAGARTPTDTSSLSSQKGSSPSPPPASHESAPSSTASPNILLAPDPELPLLHPLTVHPFKRTDQFSKLPFTDTHPPLTLPTIPLAAPSALEALNSPPPPFTLVNEAIPQWIRRRRDPRRHLMASDGGGGVSERVI